MTHVLYYPDGNRRYAREAKISYSEAYIKGGKSLELLTEFFLCGDLANELTYVGSCEHTSKRDDGTFPIIYDAARITLEGLAKTNFFARNIIDFQWVAHGNKAPKEITSLCEELGGRNQDSSKIMRVLFDYSLDEDRRQAYDESKDYDNFKKQLLIPEVDLVLRPLELRASNGPVYAMGQAQWIELPVLNPSVKKIHLQDAWDKYQEHLRYRKTTNPVHREKNPNLSRPHKLFNPK